MDSVGGNITLKKDTIKEIEKLKSDFDPLDTWRVRNPSFRKFSWRRTKPVTLRRLDYFLISSGLEQNILSCGFLSPIQSDHSPIYLKVNPLNDIMRGPGYWKFNNSLTEDATYVSRMEDLIKDIVSSFSDSDDPRINWEFLKYKIRQFTQIYSKEKARERRAKQKQHENEIKKMEDSITEHCDPILLNQLETAKVELDEFYRRINFEKQGEMV